MSQDQQLQPTKKPTKIESAGEIYRSMMVDDAHPDRDQVIERFIKELKMTHTSANTYYGNVKGQVQSEIAERRKDAITLTIVRLRDMKKKPRYQTITDILQHLPTRVLETIASQE